MLDVHADVELVFDGGRGRFRAEGQRFELEIDQPSALVDLGGRRMVGVLAEQLARAGCTLHVSSRGRVLLVAGHDARSDIFGRLLRLPHVRLSARLALGALFGPRRGTRSGSPSANTPEETATADGAPDSNAKQLQET